MAQLRFLGSTDFNLSSTVMMSEQQKTDEATLEQMKDISQSIIDSQPLIADSSSILGALQEEYQNNTDSPGFLPGLAYLDKKYARIRRVRGDGNCFYRLVFILVSVACQVYHNMCTPFALKSGFVCLPGEPHHAAFDWRRSWPSGV